MNYSVHQCHFCDSLLTKDTRYSYTVACQNKDCKHNYHVEFRQGYTLVCFEIGEYIVTFLNSPNQTIIEKGDVYYEKYEYYKVEQELLVTADNYLQVVDRVKKLQIFL